MIGMVAVPISIFDFRDTFEIKLDLNANAESILASNTDSAKPQRRQSANTLS